MKRWGAVLAAVVTLGATAVACTDRSLSSEPSAPPETSATTPTAPLQRPTTPGTPSPPAAGPPASGACYRLTVRQLAEPTNEASPVGCDDAHTARTIYVGTLDLVVHGHALAVDSARAQRQVTTRCPDQLGRFLGGTVEDRNLSRFRAVWFGPTLEESDRGAQWFRCDLVAFGRGERLLDLAGVKLRGVLDTPARSARFALCGTAAPGTRGFERVACGRPHSWRALATVPLEGGDAYPGPEAVRQAGDGRCADLVREREGFPLEFTYGWEWPTRQQWRAGQRFGYCWAPDEG